MTVDEYLALGSEERERVNAALLTPDQRARCEAMSEVAERWERRRDRERDRLMLLVAMHKEAEAVLLLQKRIRALDRLRAAALGIPMLEWEYTVGRWGHGDAEIVAQMETFTKEAGH